MDCYKEFAYIYDKLICDDIDYKGWADAIIALCKEFNIKRECYLDLACGTGNITQILAKEFNNVWAVDLSQDMLSQAEFKMRNLGIKTNFICGDICEINLNKKFDLITCCLDSINYILKDKKIDEFFNNIYLHLKDNGIFVFDINSYYKLTKILGNNIYTYDSEKVFYTWENYIDKDIIEMYLTFFVKDNTMYKRFDEEHMERAYKQNFLDNILTKNGLVVIKKLDNYCEKQINNLTERITYIVKR